MLRQLPARVAVVAENFSKQRFREQGWKGVALEPWKKRKRDKPRDNGRAILVKSGALRRSIKARASGMNVIISSDSPYAEAHNEGFSGSVSETVGAHSRKGHERKGYTRSDGRKVAAVHVKQYEVGAFVRKRNVDLPQRQFIGPSAALDKEVCALIESEINRVFK